ncbi:MAG TPA: methyltransferase domain-containing protein [Acidimicrobiales bacterium]|nr:methyltransferase domain-containing protein [Acidimicrobiales bacterium]
MTGGLRGIASRVRRARMTSDERALFAEPWYHDFSPLGLPTRQRGGIFPDNQAAKQGPIFRLLDDALGRAAVRRPDPSVLELFCADGFYGLRAALCGARRVVGVDTDEREVAKARLAAKLLGVTAAEFRVADVFLTPDPACVAICAGGLYHLTDPARLLDQLRGQVSDALVVQTVYHLGRTESDYFEAPAPGWTWGCRFSYEHLLAMVAACGWRVEHAETNELLGNDRPEDRGSAYLLCTPG